MTFQTDDEAYLAALKLRSDVDAMRVLVAALRLQLLLGKANFDPNQPRVPAGNSDGGQWTAGGGPTHDADMQTILSTIARLGMTEDPDRYQRCLDLCYPLLERPRRGRDYNEWDFRRCMNACLGKNL